jgi:ankyrin repeat protein
MKQSARRFVLSLPSMVAFLAAAACVDRSGIDLVGATDACRHDDTNYFAIRISQLNQRIEGIRPGYYTYPAILAAENDAERVLVFLQHHAVSFDVTDWRGTTPLLALMAADREPTTNLVHMLLQAGQNSNAKDTYGMSALHYAAQWRGTNVLQILLEGKADPNAQDAHGNTPLHFVSNPAKARILISFGASTKIVNQSGEMPAATLSREKPRVFEALKDIL